MRRTNGKALRAWIEANGNNAKINLHLETKVSLSWIDRVIYGRYPSAPRPITRDAICKATGLSEDVLFPECKPERRTKK